MLNASKLQDNAKYLAITNHIIACVYFFFNTDWLESLPEDVRTLVTDCVKEAVDYQESIDDDAQKDALEQMKKDGVEVAEACRYSGMEGRSCTDAGRVSRKGRCLGQVH